MCPIPIQNNMHCWSIQIKKSPKYKLNDNNGDLSKKPFDITAMTPRGTLGLCCVHIAQVMTHPAVYTLPLTLQLCYKPLGILQRVTKSQKVHISSHDVLQKLHNIEIWSHDLLQKLHNINFAWHRARGFLREGFLRNRNFPFSPLTFLRTLKNSFLGIW